MIKIMVINLVKIRLPVLKRLENGTLYIYILNCISLDWVLVFVFLLANYSPPTILSPIRLFVNSLLVLGKIWDI